MHACSYDTMSWRFGACCPWSNWHGEQSVCQNVDHNCRRLRLWLHVYRKSRSSLCIGKWHRVPILSWEVNMSSRSCCARRRQIARLEVEQLCCIQAAISLLAADMEVWDCYWASARAASWSTALCTAPFSCKRRELVPMRLSMPLRGCKAPRSSRRC